MYRKIKSILTLIGVCLFQFPCAGFNGCKDLKTPNIDSFAKEGVVFTDFHVSASFCGSSRAGLTIGRYQHCFMAEYNENPVPLSEVMMSEVFHKNGYKTATFGKWHMGYEKKYHPNNRGFDEFYGFIGGHCNYFPEGEIKGNGKSMKHNGKYVNNNIVLNIDMAPTLSELAGINLPKNMHGESLVPLLKGNSKEWEKKFILKVLGTYGGVKPNLTVISKEHRLIKTFEDNTLQSVIFQELYTHTNREEVQNLAQTKQGQKLINKYNNSIENHKNTILNKTNA